MTIKHVLAALSAAALVCAAAPAFAQDDAEEPAAEEAAPADDAADEAATYEADPADVESIDAIMAATYDVISGPAGEERDWDRFLSLFAPGARLVAVGTNPEGVSVFGLNAEPSGYVERVGPFFANTGFIEEEIGRRTERYGNVVHVFSAYEGTVAPGSEEERKIRGINSFQLAYVGGRWHVVNIFWEQESDANPVPEDIIGTFE